MRLHSASQNGKPVLVRPCDYTAHKGLLFLLSEAPTSSWRPGAPGAACESPSVEDPESESARRRFPPGYLGKGLAVAPGPRGWSVCGGLVCAPYPAISCSQSGTGGETTSVGRELSFQAELGAAQLNTCCLLAGPALGSPSPQIS